MLSKICLLLICLLFCEDCGGLYNRGYWENHKILDKSGLYHLYWTVKDETITFKVEVQANGYVGFGISPNGGMRGGDVVTGWIEDGKPYFQDRHCEGNWMPEVDESQDWELLEGTENDTHTTFVFCRKLQTCDNDDFAIDTSTMRVIYAFSSEDPLSEEQIMYHKANRGKKSIVLLEEKINTGANSEEFPFWDVRGHEFTVYAENISVYWCTLVEAPNFRTKQHIVKVDSLIQPGNENIIHHMVLYGCIGEPKEFEPHIGQHAVCLNHEMPNPMNKCETMFIVWGVGGLGTILPEHVGFPFGTGEHRYYRFEIHYENLLHRNGVRDRSGFRIYYTPNLRKYDGGVLALGVIGNERLLIPPKQKQFILAGHSSPKCLGKVMPPEGINIMANLFHAHLLGRRLKLRHFRGNKELPPIADDKFYDFNYQDFHYLPKEVNVLPDDILTVECYFDSTERNITTFGGLSTIKDEMCLAYVLYYPKIDVFMVNSGITNLMLMKLTDVIKINGSVIVEPPEMSNVSFRTHVREYNFLKNVDALEDILRYGPHIAVCVNNKGIANMADGIVKYPDNFQPYEEPQLCFDSQKIITSVGQATSSITNAPIYHHKHVSPESERKTNKGGRFSPSAVMTAVIVLLASLSNSL